MTILTLALLATLLQGAAPDCPKLDTARDQMGLRVRDHDGNWRYIVPNDIVLVLVARVPGGRAVWYQAVAKEKLKELFGKCASVYGPTVARHKGLTEFWVGLTSVNFDAPVYRISLILGPALPDTALSPDHELDRSPEGRGFNTDIRAEFFRLNGTDLLLLENRIYAVDESRQATELIGASAQDREKITGVVRQIADALSEKGATKIGKVTAYFKEGKLQAVIQIKGRVKETLNFVER